MSRPVIAGIAVIVAVLALVLFGFGRSDSGGGPVVLAASSLQESLEDVADAWVAEGHPRPVLSFAGTPALARQISAGAPADLFVSADEKWMDELAGEGLLRAGTRASFLTNRLVLVAPAASTVVLSPEPGFPVLAALDGGKLAMADPETVPAGRYGRQSLTALGVWPHLAPRVAQAENVRAALALVARREAPLGVVYATDALTEPGVRVVATLPERTHARITYPVAVLAKSTQRDAEAFRRFLLSPQAKAIFRRHGFGAP